MAYRVEIDPYALMQAIEAYMRIAEDSPDRAERWYDGLLAKIESLARYPRRCPRARESGAYRSELRELLYGKRRHAYRVLFAIEGEVVRVVAVWHSARGPFTR